MICPHCNEKYSDSMVVCPYCGKSKNSKPIAQPEQPKIKLPTNVKIYDMPPMKWYYYDVWGRYFFLVFLGAILFGAIFITLFPLALGLSYDKTVSPALVLFIVTTICMYAGYIVLTQITRNKLLKFKKDARIWALITNITGLIMSLILQYMGNVATGAFKNELVYTILTVFPDLVANIIAICCVNIYYKKREPWFVN